MKFVTYSLAADPTSLRPGLRFSDSNSPEQDLIPALGLILDIEKGLNLLSALETVPPLSLFSSVLTIIENEAKTLPALRSLESQFKAGKIPHSMLLPERGVTLHSPIPRPPSMRDGYAFRQHVESARKGRGLPMIPEFDNFPIFYYTNHLQVTGPGPVVVQKQAQERLDYELEAAIVIGKPGKNIPASRADEHIFGYTIMNDWSARELQTQEMKLNLGPAKGKDFATSLGPYLITRDELTPHAIDSPTGERHNLKMLAFLNGEKIAESNLKEMTWSFAQIIERASYGVGLISGEVIGSGTCGTGCFMETNTYPGAKVTWLKPGDQMKLEIEGLGQLENTIVDGGE